MPIAIALLLAACSTDLVVIERQDSSQPFAPGATWQIQLSSALDASSDADVYMIDVDEHAGEIDSLHADGRSVVCYFSAGSLEGFRDDVTVVAPSAIGGMVPDYPEQWLDVRDESVRALAVERLDRAAENGCDAVVPSLLDAYESDTGFDLTAADQSAFNAFVAASAHDRGLSIGLTNTMDLVGELAGSFDFGMLFHCYEPGRVPQRCDSMSAFVESGRAVFEAEPFELPQGEVCSYGTARNFSVIFKNEEADAARGTCP
jgi:hypothetical protein